MIANPLEFQKKTEIIFKMLKIVVESRNNKMR